MSGPLPEQVIVTMDMGRDMVTLEVWGDFSAFPMLSCSKQCVREKFSHLIYLTSTIFLEISGTAGML